MNVLTTTWRQLVSRRLWPVALLLVAALVAVPVLLKKDPEPLVPAAPATSEAPAENAKADADAFTEPVVSKASTSDRSRRRRVLGSRKDPFEPAPVKKAKKTKTKTQSTDDHTTTPADPAPVSPPTSSPAPSTPVAPAPTPKKKVYKKGSLIVRFGEATGSPLKRINLQELGGLPNDEDKEPLLVYTGLVDHGHKAQFLLDASLDATGDATCRPHPSNCEQIELAAGETEFLDVIDPESGDAIAQYELDVVKIN
jgi:hypothetical protein